MANDKKSSIIKDALTDYNAIIEAADANAKKKLAEEFPEKFNNLLKEELQNKNKKGYKKIEEPEKDKDETVMKNQEKETKVVVKEKAGEGKPFTEKTKGTEQKVEETAGDGKPFGEKVKAAPQVEETVTITDTVGKGDPFKEKAKKAEKIEEEAGEGKPFTEKSKDVKGDISVEQKAQKVEEDVKIIDTRKEGKPFTEKKKGEKPLQKEELDITGLDVDSVGQAIEGAGQDDELLTMEQIEEEITKMENLGDTLEAATPAGDNTFGELVEMRDKLNKMIEMHSAGGEERFGTSSQVAQLHQGNPLIDEKGVDEMHAAGGEERFGTSSQVAQLHQGNPLIDEEGVVTDADVEAVLGAPAGGEVEESQTRTLGNQKKQTANLPGVEYKQSAVPKMRPAMRGGVEESQKKISGLIEENKKLTKKLNETKKYKESVGTLVEGYKSALEKYRNQLKEMAIFNTNLAHVNNLLVNEELALTQDDKIKIINEFKKVDSIATSQTKYKAILTEMKESKKTLTESVERKVSASVQPSSKQALNEVVEKTAYADDKHLQRMRKIIETIENRGKKIIK